MREMYRGGSGTAMLTRSRPDSQATTSCHQMAATVALVLACLSYPAVWRRLSINNEFVTPMVGPDLLFTPCIVKVE